MYPYQFCQVLAHILLRHLKVKPLDNEVYLLEDLFEPFTIKQVDILRKEMEAIDKEFNMTSSSLAVRIQDLPFNKDVQPCPEVSEHDEAVPTGDWNRYLQTRSND